MHIVYDIDDVLADFWGTALPIMNNHFRTDVEKHHFVEYSDVGSHFGISQQDFMKFLVDFDILHKLKPTPLSTMVLSDYKLGNEITMISSRDYHPEAYEVTKQWLLQNEIPHHNLHISGKRKKSDFVEGVDIIIDDHTKNIDDFFDTAGVMNKDGIGFLINQPWNQGYKRKRVIRL